jgi:hypothetical protein
MFSDIFCIIDFRLTGFANSNREKIDTLKCTDIFYTFSIEVSRSNKLYEFNIILYLNKKIANKLINQVINQTINSMYQCPP